MSNTYNNNYNSSQEERSVTVHCCTYSQCCVLKHFLPSTLGTSIVGTVECAVVAIQELLPYRCS
jgi:hypothetical protein